MKIKYAIVITLLFLLQPLLAQTLLWDREYNGPGGGGATVMDATMDNALNVYVTGYTSQSSGYDGRDITTIKYNRYGDTLWTTHHDVWGYRDGSHSICLDARGNAYVVGFAKSFNNIIRLVVIKYNGSNGNIEWSNSILLQEPGYYNYKIAVDTRNNVYVATCRISDFWLLKFNGATGEIIWDLILDQGGSEVWRDMILDAAGNIYVAGTCVSGSTERVFTAKYLPDGDIEWLREYNLVETEGCDGIDIDNYGNVYVGGTSWYSTGISHPIILKYNNSGNLLWDYHYYSQTTSVIRDIKVHRLTEASYIAGSIWRNNDWNVLVIAVDGSGNKIWEDEYDGSSNLRDQAYELEVTSHGVYVSGYSETNNYDFLTMCYARSTGHRQWAATYDFGGSDISYNVVTKYSVPYTYIVAAGKRTAPNAFATLMYSYLEISEDPPYGTEAPLFYAQLYPNPAKDILRIRFSSPDERMVTIKLYNVAGRLVQNIFDGRTKIGLNEIRYKSTNISDGIYFVQIKAEGCQRTMKVIIKK